MAKHFIIFILITIAGCASMETQQRLSSLDMTARQYGDAVRWGHYDVAIDFFKPGNTEGPDNFTPVASNIGNIKLTSYEPVNRTLSKDTFEAHQTVEIKYYLINQMIERTLLDRQIWRYDTEDDRWYLHSGLPQFVSNSNK